MGGCVSKDKRAPKTEEENAGLVQTHIKKNIINYQTNQTTEPIIDSYRSSSMNYFRRENKTIKN